MRHASGIALHEALSIAIHNLRRNVLRTLLSTLGVIIGVASLVAILALGDGLERYSRAQIEATTDLQSLTIRPRTEVVKDGIKVRRETIASLSDADLAALAAMIRGRADHAPFVLRSAWAAAGKGAEKHPVLFGATTAEAAKLLASPLVAGRYLAQSDVATDAPVAVVPEAVAAWYRLEPARVVGRRLMLDGRELTIVGVVSAPKNAPVRLHVPLSARVKASIDPAQTPLSVAFRARRVEDVEPLAKDLEGWLATRFGSKDAFEVANNRFRAAQARQAMLVFKLVMGSIAGISLLVGGIGIMNILLASVFERTREIGVRRAAGARSRDVLLQFLAEAVAISATGSLLGVLLGLTGAFGITAAVRHFTEAPIHAAFTWGSVVSAAGAALLIGIVFGTYPAKRAASLSPVEAIRYE